MRVRVVLGALAIAATMGCGRRTHTPKPANVTETEPEPVCAYETRSVGTGAAARALYAPTWFAFLLPGYRMSTGEVATPVRTCTGLPVQWSTLDRACNDLEPPAAALPSVPLTEKDLALTKLSETRRLVWAAAQRLDDGQALGPVALAEFTADRLVIRALGPLRAMPERARLRLEPLGLGHVLVAEGEHCGPGETKNCPRAIRLMPLVGQRFDIQPLRDENGTCIEPALLTLSRTETMKTKSGRARRLVMTGNATFGRDELTMHEEIDIFEVGEGGKAGKQLRHAATDRIIRLRGSRLVTSDPSLWTRMTADLQ